MKPSHAWRNDPDLLSRPVKLLHIYETVTEVSQKMSGSYVTEDKKGRLIGTIAILIGFGEICHIGVSHVSPQEKNPTKKAGRIIATNRARLEFARVYGLTDRRPQLQEDVSSTMFTAPVTSLGRYFQRMGLEQKDVSEVARLKDDINRLEALAPDDLIIDGKVETLEDTLGELVQIEQGNKNGVEQRAG